MRKLIVAGDSDGIIEADGGLVLPVVPIGGVLVVLMVSMVLRCYIDAIIWQSLGPRHPREQVGPVFSQFPGAPGLVLPVTRAIARGDPAH